MKTWFQRVVLARLWLTYLVFGCSFFAFGAGSLNLFHLLQANLQLLSAYGIMVLLDGGAQQLIEIFVTGYVSLSAYIIFKACEYRLTHWLTDR